MKTKLISTVLLLAFVLSGCGFWGVRGNGRIKDESRKVAEFRKIEAGGAFSIHVKVGPATSIRISAEENLLGYIRTNVKGNTLVIDTRKNISPRKQILIEITTPYLNDIEVSGANDIEIEGINETEFDVDLSGAGNIHLIGEVEKLRAELSGAGNINARELKAKEVLISVSGAASADVYATKYLDASVSGVGSIDYYGNPEKTRTNVSGVGSITRK
ncbi:MAG: head GIN domain-containing protein [Melioribacteraceae bacterium]